MKIRHILADAISAASIEFTIGVAIICVFVVMLFFAKYLVK
jgi:hypothetical protein